MKKILVNLLIVTVLTLNCMSVSYAMSNWVKASGAKVVVKNDYEWGSGYVTAKKNHYASVCLYRQSNNKPIAKSGRKWGKGKVTATTKKLKLDSPLGAMFDSARVFYGN